MRGQAEAEPEINGLPLPVINLGLPKSGTTSLHDFFKCATGYNVSHWSCKRATRENTHFGEAPSQCESNTTQLFGQPCGSCIRENLFEKRPPLEGCGDYQVWTQIDFETCDGERVSLGRKWPSKVAPRLVALIPEALPEVQPGRFAVASITAFGNAGAFSRSGTRSGSCTCSIPTRPL